MGWSLGSRRRSVIVMASAVGLAVLASAPVQAKRPGPTAGGYVTQRLSSPGRTVVTSTTGSWLATFTDGARTVAVSGPSRRFGETTTTSTVTTSTWVRLLATPFAGSVDAAWLTARLSDSSQDVLAVAMQYVTGAPSVFNASGLRIAGDADYGPLQADGTRQAGSDFNDYLGLSWTYPSGTLDPAESSEIGAIDCSGYMRMVWGYRGGIPLSLSPDGGHSLPRHSWEILGSGPGVVVIPNSGARPSSRSALQVGDLVGFDASTTDGSQIDHVGMFLGRDSAGHDRFVSSRKTANGPTLGDLGGLSALDGTGLYAVSFRTARRI